LVAYIYQLTIHKFYSEYSIGDGAVYHLCVYLTRNKRRIEH
jgi:hypothetical protein